MKGVVGKYFRNLNNLLPLQPTSMYAGWVNSGTKEGPRRTKNLRVFFSCLGKVLQSLAEFIISNLKCFDRIAPLHVLACRGKLSIFKHFNLSIPCSWCKVGDGDTCPLGPISFIFMQFLAKKLPINRLAHPTRDGAPSMGTPGSATDLYISMITETCFSLFWKHFFRKRKLWHISIGNEANKHPIERKTFIPFAHNYSIQLTNRQHFESHILMHLRC